MHHNYPSLIGTQLSENVKSSQVHSLEIRYIGESSFR